MYFDTHAHYDDEQFNGDRAEILTSMPENGITLIVNAASSLDSTKKAISLAEQYSFIYASAGVHPHDTDTMDDRSITELEVHSEHPKVVAIGEIGLDYHYDYAPRDIQRQRFREQLDLARKVHLPVIIHERESWEDCLKIIRDYGDLRGVFHCFSGSWETAKIILDMGWYLSFTGAITFKDARRALEVIEKMPQDRLMIETDSPYLAPVPLRGRRNSSQNLHYVAQTMADILRISVEDVALLTMENGKRFFEIK